MRAARKVEDDFDGRFLREVAGAPGNLGGLVADAFQVLRHFHAHGHQAQVGGQRRLGQQLDGHLVDFNFELVNDVVVLAHLQGEVVVALHERLHGIVHGGLGMAGHEQKFFPQFLQAQVKMIVHVLNRWLIQPGSAETSGHVVLRAFLRRFGEYFRSGPEFHQVAQIKKGCEIG